MATMTCRACSVSFDEVELGRQHYKTDWHCYNLKRIVANLIPITLEKFKERQQQQLSKGEVGSHSKKPKDAVTGNTKKKGKNKKKVQGGQADQSSTLSKAFKEVVTVQDVDVCEDEEVDSDVESWDSYDENSLGLEECLFCSRVSSSMENNLAHMTAVHGFFLPDAEYISDLEGLITYLGEKVGAGHFCLWCNKRFHSTKDVQRHMVDKGHCKLQYEGDNVFEFSDFYDYSTSYPDQSTTEASPDDAVDLEELESDGFSLTLPSGATIGHRSLVKYYKQNLEPYMHARTRKVLPKMLAQYKALGWTGSSALQVEKRVQDVQYMQRLRNNYHTKLGTKANNLRHRFRDPNGPGM